MDRSIYEAQAMNDLAKNRAAPPHPLMFPTAASSKNKAGILSMNLKHALMSHGGSRDKTRGHVINNSSSSLVSAITLDEEAFQRSHAVSSSFSTKNAAFDFKPLPPVRGPSFASLTHPAELCAEKARRHSTGEDTNSSTNTFSRFDLVCNSTGLIEQGLNGSTPFRTPGIHLYEPYAPSSYESIVSPHYPEEMLCSSIRNSTVGNLSISYSHKGQIQSMFPLSKPMRRDVSGATMKVVNKTNICTSNNVTASNAMSTSPQNASIWVFPSQKKPENPLLMSSRLKSSLLPGTTPDKHAGRHDKWQEVSRNNPRDVQIRSVARTKTPPSVKATEKAVSSSRTSHALQNSKSFLMSKERGVVDVTDDACSAGSTACTSSSSGNKAHSWMTSPPHATRICISNNLHPAARSSMSEYPREECRDPGVAEAGTSSQTASGHKRSIMRGSSSTNSLDRSGGSQDSCQRMKRFRRHSAPWIASTNDYDPLKKAAGSPLSRLALKGQLDVLSLTTHELPLEAHINDAFPRIPCHRMQSESQYNSLVESFPATPIRLRKSTLMRFTGSRQGSDVDRSCMMIIPQRHNSETDLEFMEDDDIGHP